MARDVNCWPCESFVYEDAHYFCKRRVKSFPKRCGHFTYEPGSDYDERVYQREKGEKHGEEN